MLLLLGLGGVDDVCARNCLCRHLCLHNLHDESVDSLVDVDVLLGRRLEPAEEAVFLAVLVEHCRVGVVDKVALVAEQDNRQTVRAVAQMRVEALLPFRDHLERARVSHVVHHKRADSLAVVHLFQE